MKKYTILFSCFSLLTINAGIAQEFQDVKDSTKEAKEDKRPYCDCNSDLEYDQDADMVYHMKTGKPYTGLCRSFFEDGSEEMKTEFVNGKIDGESVKLYPENEKGQQIIEYKLHYDKGNPDGTWDYFYKNGRRAWTESYKGGFKEGNCNYYYEDGKPKKEEVWKGNLKNGNCKEYYPGAKIKQEIEYKDGIMNGAYKTYYENGQVEYEGKYINGIQDGEINMYYQNGQMSSQLYYDMGVETGEWKTWFDDGKERSNCKYIIVVNVKERKKEGVKDGTAKEFYKDGQLKKEEIWKSGKRTSVEAYDEFGNKLDPDEIKD
jgi:antitoxin component YwqK of YwqJK toxin-antitoxin module